MKYQVKRGDQIFGPYTLADLQRYVQTGNIVLTDLTQSEGMSDWAPVSQVIGNITVPSVYSPPAYSPANVGYGAAVAPVAQPGEMVELPPNLHWALLLLIEIFTLGIFNLAWALVLANWARKLNKDNGALILMSIYPAGVIGLGIVDVAVTASGDPALAGLSLLIKLGILIVYVFGSFKIKNAMEEYYNSTENFGLRLSGVMTFFFSTIYLQYHVNELTKFKARAPLGISYR